MIVENPEVTMDEEAHLMPEGARVGGSLEWSCIANVQGDDGKQYRIDFHISSYENLSILWPSWGITEAADMSIIAVRWEDGKVVQPPGSVIRIADFPQIGKLAFQAGPRGALTVNRTENQVAVDYRNFHIICKDDKTWHYSVEDKERGIKAEFVHNGVGFPTWYGKEKLQVHTPHTTESGGYMWSGTVEGTLTLDGRKVEIKGKGCRQRYYTEDVCSGEAGAWHEWLWFHFDEIHGGLLELKYSRCEEVSIYLIDEKQYFPDCTVNVEHYDWAYLPHAGVLIPTRYKATFKTEAGVLEVAANVIGYHCWSCTGEVPDIPPITLDFDKLDGTFTYKDGRKRTLSNGLGGTLIILWKPYPNIVSILAPELLTSAETMLTKSL